MSDATKNAPRTWNDALDKDDLTTAYLFGYHKRDYKVQEQADRIEALEAENERLAAETEQAKTLYRETLNRAVKAEAENARLREALMVYAESCDATDTISCGYEGNMCCMTARAALSKTGETG